MASFIATQLDFIFFFYGFAFILLGGVSFAISRHDAPNGMWVYLGWFGILHGANEWFDLTAVVLGDSAPFAWFRTGLVTVSFMLLLEFARVGAQQLGWRVPGRWIYVPLVAIPITGGIAHGVDEANALARYTFGLTGALGSSLIFVLSAQRLTGSHRHLAISAALALFCYGLAAGLVVPAAPIWPADVLNQTWFSDATGLPIQLVCGLLACWAAFVIWGIWGRKITQKISAPHYSRYLNRLFTGTLSAMGLILVLGWVLTQYLGEIYKQNVENEARSDIDLVAGYLSSETALIEGIAVSLAAAPPVQAYLSGAPVRETWIDEMLALDAAAARAGGGIIFDSGGNIIASFGNYRDIAMIKTGLLHEALRGQPVHHFVHEPSSGTTFFYVLAPVRDATTGEIRGAVSFERSLATLTKDLVTFAKPLALVDPDGLVVLTNQPAWSGKRLWPAAGKPLGAETDGLVSLLDEEITGAVWIRTDGSRTFVQRRFVDSTEWSVVLLTSAPGIFASRVLGIVITLMGTGMVLVYLAGSERHIHDKFQMEQRLELEELARELSLKATTDPLTGLSNRLKLNHQLDRELSRAVRYGSPISLIIYDVDRFKQINDTYGHPAGDKVLVGISKLARDTIRKSDLLARWGGEEFAILVPETNAKGAGELARGLRAAIERLEFDEAVRVTCSFGVAEYCAGDTAEGLIARADGALYRAKMGGRNRVEIAPPPGRSPVGQVA